MKANPQTPEASPRSERLKTLQAETSESSREELDTYWAEIARDGAPLMEPLPEHADSCLVTFLWREQESEPVDNVTTLAWFLTGDAVEHRLERLPKTDVLYLSVPMRADIHSNYLFLLNDVETPLRQDPDVEARLWRAICDPLNPLRVMEPGA